MVTILPVRDLETLEEVNQKYGTQARFACRLFEAEEVTGAILYDVDFAAGEGKILLLDAADDEAADGLCRAAFSILADAGVDTAVFAEEAAEGAPERLGFLKSGSRRTGSLRSILRGCAHCVRA